jgi:hypothetical protein
VIARKSRFGMGSRGNGQNDRFWLRILAMVEARDKREVV